MTFKKSGQGNNDRLGGRTVVFRVDRLIYIYMALCACLLLFNLAYAGQRRISGIRSPYKIKWWEDYLKKSMLSEAGAMSRQEEKRLVRRLSRVSELLYFQETVDRLRKESDAKSVARLDAWLLANRPCFVRIGSRYLKKEVMVKAYYAYVVWQNRLCGDNEQDVIVRYMLTLVGEHSIYCRENALQAVYSSKNPVLVVKAYKIMERYQVSHSQKLVTDGLITFAGDKEELAESIWREWNSFTPYYQSAFIDFMRLAAGNLGSRLLPLLSTDTDREVQFAVLRYLRRNRYEGAAPVLRDLVSQWDVDDWEFPALAALALENYPCEETFQALYEGMHSTSWYVRNNVSDTLLKIDKDGKVLEKIVKDGDKYALEMLQYKVKRQEEECANDGRD